jgi:hypothetical protein
MKIGIMQPYFMPYLGYFALIKHTDKFVLFDPVQFVKHGWIERNRVLKPSEGWQYVAAPLTKHSRETKISEIEINNSSDWRDKMFRQLEHYKKRAPFYKETIDVLKRALDIETKSIVSLNENCLKVVCEYIGINLDIDIFSSMDLNIDEVNAPDEWALNICTALGDVTEYWNPEGGMEFFDKSKYDSKGIDIKFLKMNLPFYKQRRPDFVPGLSIIDVMMFNDPKDINNMLDDFELIST